MAAACAPSGTVACVLRFTYGTMAAGKSTLALQLHWQLASSGRRVELWTFGDRSGSGRVTSRIGIEAAAVAVRPGEDLGSRLAGLVAAGIQDLVVDEAQFATAGQVDQIATLVDDHGVEVHMFGLAADFTLTLFEGAARLFALADHVVALPVEARCWCGAPARCNARVAADGTVLREGPQRVIGDVNRSTGPGAAFTYEVLCRSHYRRGESRARTGARSSRVA